MASLQVVIGANTWLSEIGSWGDLEYTLGWPGDCLEATFQITTAYRAHHPLLRRDVDIQINRAGWPIWRGKLQEPEWNGADGVITCRGLYRLGENYSALNTAGEAIDNLAVAMDAQIARGLNWRRDPSIPTAPLNTGTTELGNSLAALADQYAQNLGVHWGVDAFRRAYFAGAPSTPAYHVVPGAAELSPGDESFASHVLLRIIDETGSYRTASWPPLGDTPNVYELRWGHNDWRRDMTGFGQIPYTTAIGIAQNIYERGKLRPGWTQGLDLLPGELLTAHGDPADFDGVRGNELVRVHGVRDEISHTPYTDFIIGRVRRVATEKTIHIDPIGLESRTEDDVFQEVLEAATAALGPDTTAWRATA